MKISDISITHRRLPLDPPFRASWDTRPRTKFEATIVRVKPGWSLDRRDFVLTEPIDVDAEGWLVLTDKPGFGIELDEDRLKATRFAQRLKPTIYRTYRDRDDALRRWSRA